MNPARAIGPAIVASKWKGHWIYWAGSLVGGSVAAILYEYVLAPDSSIQKLKEAFPLKKKRVEISNEKTKESDNEITDENKTELQEVNTE